MYGITYRYVSLNIMETPYIQYLKLFSCIVKVLLELATGQLHNEIMKESHLSSYMNMFIEFILLSLAYSLHAHNPNLACAFLNVILINFVAFRLCVVVCTFWCYTIMHKCIMKYHLNILHYYVSS